MITQCEREKTERKEGKKMPQDQQTRGTFGSFPLEKKKETDLFSFFRGAEELILYFQCTILCWTSATP